jgi:ubiquinone/menaquinone biosynthesis C-methylase UbiE
MLHRLGYADHGRFLMSADARPDRDNDWLARLGAALAYLRLKTIRSGPHFVRDYRLFAEKLVMKYGLRRAMELAGGGEFVAIGRLQAELLRHLGLRAGHSIIDVGCGSGRLSTAISQIADIHYHGTDVVERFLAHARSASPRHFRFSRVDGTAIPEADGVADFVTMFSVVTHLHHYESYLYLQEGKRVLRPGGRLVFSFLEMLNPPHWNEFIAAVASARRQRHAHLNTFVEVPVIHEWASRLELVVEHVYRAGTPSIPLAQPIVCEAGHVLQGFGDLGQSIAVLRKP